MERVWQIFCMRPNMWVSVDLMLLSHFAALQSFKLHISKSGWLVKKHVRCIKFSSHFVKKILILMDNLQFYLCLILKSTSRIQGFKGVYCHCTRHSKIIFQQLLVEHYIKRENGEVWRIEIMPVNPSQYFSTCLQHGWCTRMHVL